jgi:protease-4
VDQLGGLNEAVDIVRKKAGLSATGETNLVMYPPRRSLFELLSNTTPETLGDAAAESKLRAMVPNLPGRAFLKGGLLRILPYSLSVR